MADDQGLPCFPYVDRVLTRPAEMPPALHLGYWEWSPRGRSPGGRDPAAALDESVLDIASLADGQTIVDVGCGLGATLARIDQTRHDLRLVGVNIDSRQLDACRSVVPVHTNLTTWVRADAVALPIPDAVIDRVLCIEAAPHFASRRRFLSEAARVLVPGGRLVGTDMFVRLGAAGDGSPPDDVCESVLRRGAGSWPHVFEPPEAVLDAAARVGFRVLRWDDISANIAPNFPVEIGAEPSDADPVGAMIRCLGALQHSGRLRSVRFGFERTS